LAYVRERSFFGDIKLIFRTLFGEKGISSGHPIQP